MNACIRSASRTPAKWSDSSSGAFLDSCMSHCELMDVTGPTLSARCVDALNVLCCLALPEACLLAITRPLSIAPSADTGATLKSAASLPLLLWETGLCIFTALPVAHLPGTLVAQAAPASSTVATPRAHPSHATPPATKAARLMIVLCWILHTARICVDCEFKDLLVLSLSFCSVVKMSAALLRGLPSPPHALLSPPQHVHLPSPSSTISPVSPVPASIAAASRQFSQGLCSQPHLVTGVAGTCIPESILRAFYSVGAALDVCMHVRMMVADLETPHCRGVPGADPARGRVQCGAGRVCSVMC